eukprot:TRINITY_DN18432_c0_g1_i3.p1 TRINITY_DN18432_c0_g1~~TRINITY_DN18432_c0_g1_i3.p1  ORF type:complete len:107 (+),score=18.10 TRINITY_DN18432_c0_g1_i3:174-494(+)
MSWVGIAMISQHAGIWALVLALWPFAQCEHEIEVWTGQRYGLVMSPLRTKRTVCLKNVPGLATELLQPITEHVRQWGELEAGMAASNLDGSTVAGWRANATQRVVS